MDREDEIGKLTGRLCFCMCIIIGIHVTIAVTDEATAGVDESDVPSQSPASIHSPGSTSQDPSTPNCANNEDSGDGTCRSNKEKVTARKRGAWAKYWY
jgi:hypothetical protein